MKTLMNLSSSGHCMFYLEAFHCENKVVDISACLYWAIRTVRRSECKPSR